MVTEEPARAVVKRLETARLTLRPVTRGDADFLFELDSDPEVMRYLSGGPATPRSVIEERVLPTFLARDPENPGFGFWTARLKDSGARVGWFCFRLAGEASREVILGFRLLRAVWGRGLATEGARALIERGFAEWGAERVTATTYEENVGSRRVLEKAGLRFARSFRLAAEDLAAVDTFDAGAGAEGAEPWDGNDVEYVLERRDWLAAAD